MRRSVIEREQEEDKRIHVRNFFRHGIVICVYLIRA